MILVTGATGSNGTEVVKRLSRVGAPLRAMVRDRGNAGSVALPGVEVVEGDFDRPETLAAALDGVERAFLLTPSSERAGAQQAGFVEAARRAGVRQVVKLSQLAADVRSPGRFQRYHAEVEALLAASGMAHTLLRPNLFMQGLLNFAPMIAARGAFAIAAGDARVSAVDVRDIADAAVAALTGPLHEARAYDLTGPEALTHAEMAAHLAAALGRPVAFVDLPESGMREALLGVGFPAWQADGLLEEYALYRAGEAAEVTSGVLDATGHPPRAFPAFARDYAPDFSRS